MSLQSQDLKREPAIPISQAAPVPEEIPARFQPPRSALWIDRFMTHFIKVGGLSIIVAVFGIFVFILMQILPLFKRANVKEVSSVSITPEKYAAIGVDEWGELPVLIA